MTKEQFNSLPLEARNFIQKHSGCLSCGNAESKLTKGYALYLTYKKMNTYVLFGGGVNYSQEGERGILRAVRDTDSPLEVREKIKIARLVHAKSPELFISYDEKAIEALLESLPTEEVVNLDSLEFNTATASYEDLKAFVKDNGIETQGTKKKDLIKAIEALANTEGYDLL